MWTFTAETIGILMSQLIVALMSFRETQRVFDAYVVFLTYPACLFLVAALEVSETLGAPFARLPPSNHRPHFRSPLPRSPSTITTTTSRSG